MEEKNKYIGITIGPIFDTLNLTSSPAALWAASYMFSSCTRSICEILTDEYSVDPKKIVSPYYSKIDEFLNKNDGVGLFHDRIIFWAEDFDFNNIKAVRSTAIEKLATVFSIPKEYLDEYVMIAAAMFEAQNPILEAGPILDSLELAKPFVFKEESNPILGLFINESVNEKSEGEQAKVGKNEAVKALTNGFRNFQLRKTGTNMLKSLYDIVHTGDGLKKYKYYALVRSDGDNMSKIISSLENDDAIQNFSKTCLEYCEKISETVGAYNGVTIFAGGDDLLAILPCASGNEKTPFDFIAEANDIFREKFKKYNQPVSLSFGITIAYYKFPLYEALSDSAEMLFGIAKSVKNCTAIRIQKHAGQSEGLLISNDAIDRFLYLQQSIWGEKSETLLSAMHKIKLFESAFDNSFDFNTIKNLFVNTFDAAAHKENSFVHKVLPEIFYGLRNQAGIYAIDENGIQHDNAVLTMYYMLRIMKFFVEKDGEEG